MPKRVIFILIFVVIVGITLIVGYRAIEQGVYDFYAYLDVPEINTVNTFLNAALTGDEQKAFAYLSENLKTAVTQHCPEGKVARCFDKVVEPEWGTFERASADPNFNKITDRAHLVFYVTWKHEQRLVALTIIKESDNWRIDSWRGFIPLNSSDGERDLLKTGRSTQNQFPPPDFPHNNQPH